MAGFCSLSPSLLQKQLKQQDGAIAQEVSRAVLSGLVWTGLGKKEEREGGEV